MDAYLAALASLPRQPKHGRSCGLGLCRDFGREGYDGRPHFIANGYLSELQSVHGRLVHTRTIGDGGFAPTGGNQGKDGVLGAHGQGLLC